MIGRSLAGFAIVFLLHGCGGDAPKPLPPPPATASAVAPPPAPPPPELPRVDFMEGRAAAAPAKRVRLQIDSPGDDQSIAERFLPTFKLVFSVGNFEALPAGSYIQLTFDGAPFRPITDPKEKLLLKDISPNGELALGEHFITAHLALPSKEIVREEIALVVRRFWAGRATPSKWNTARDPYLVVAAPLGVYEGPAAQDIVVDFFAVNATLAEKQHSIRATLKGPGIDAPAGLQMTLTNWLPLYVFKAREGDYTLQSELVGPDGKVIEGPWHPAVRAFTVRGAK